jgi:flagellum-specific peptidoglycan hydrolase FlgJ
MIWNFLKTHWFSIATAILLLAAIIRGSGLSFGMNSENTSPDKVTALHKRSEPTTLGLASTPSDPEEAPVEIDQATATAFLKRFAPLAISERKKFGVPASVLLATAFLNSHMGMSEAATQANNFFALPCSIEWDGASATIDDQCVRQYETAWASWRDFSIHLTQQPWYGELRNTAGKNWQKWAKGIEPEHISSIAGFNKKMAEVITYYQLEALDNK